MFYSLFPIIKQCPALPGKQGLARRAVALKDKCHNNELFPSASFFLTFMSEQMFYGMKYPFLSVWVNNVPPDSTGGKRNVGETALMLWEHGSAVPKTLLCYQHLSNSNAQHRAMRLLWRDLTPSQPDKYSLT